MLEITILSIDSLVDFSMACSLFAENGCLDLRDEMIFFPIDPSILTQIDVFGFLILSGPHPVANFLISIRDRGLKSIKNLGEILEIIISGFSIFCFSIFCFSAILFMKSFNMFALVIFPNKALVFSS